MLKPGQVVISKNGRDKGRAMVVVSGGVFPDANSQDGFCGNPGCCPAGSPRAAPVACIKWKSEGEFVYLADGRTRTLAKPKKKKAKHLQPTNYFMDLSPPDGRGLQDADIRKSLGFFLERR